MGKQQVRLRMPGLRLDDLAGYAAKRCKVQVVDRQRKTVVGVLRSVSPEGVVLDDALQGVEWRPSARHRHTIPWSEVWEIYIETSET
jgi:hypothetical protein